MRIVVQRVSRATVTVADVVSGSIGAGLLLLVGIAPTDTDLDIDRAAEKIAALRIFPDERGQMNRSLLESGGSALVVSQFTLLGDVRRGRRPSFVGAAPPEMARSLLDRIVASLSEHGVQTEAGIFGAAMAVELVNDGPVTLVLDVKDGRVS
ncbi:MAG TPA: D-aminoacyl-tRNA deacylase [Acidimicrobiia bacterium]